MTRGNGSLVHIRLTGAQIFPYPRKKIRRLLAIQNQLIRFLEGTDLLELYPGMTINLAWFLEHPRTINLNNPLRPLLSSREAGQGVRLIELFDLVQGLGNDWLPFLIWVN
jgi:hypothetical protein